MNEMRVLFQQLVSPELKQLSELVSLRGGVKALRGNEKTFLELERVVAHASSQSSVSLEVHTLRNDIFEDPTVAAESNWKVFSRKFDAQRNQIVNKLTLVVRQESDRVIREVQGIAHERIRDRVCFLYLTTSLNSNYHMVLW
jgi:hypothetical protein